MTCYNAEIDAILTLKSLEPLLNCSGVAVFISFVSHKKHNISMFQSSVIRADSLYPDKWSIVDLDCSVSRLYRGQGQKELFWYNSMLKFQHIISTYQLHNKDAKTTPRVFVKFCINAILLGFVLHGLNLQGTSN